MSDAGHCPVCGEPKEMRRHLVCPHCWVRVPDADQAEICELYEKAEGSTAMQRKSLAVIRALKEARHAAHT